MKVTIQTLKAPWPAGAKVGDIVAFEGDAAPAWAVGKFALAPENAEADFHYEPKEVELDAPRQAPVSEAQANQERDAAVWQALGQLQDQIMVEAQARVAAIAAEAAARAQHEARVTEALERIGPVGQRLDPAETAPKAKTREDLNAEGEKLGIKVDGRWSDERLAEEIAKAGKK